MSHTEDKTLAEIRAKYCAESTSYVCGLLADELEMVERTTDPGKKARHNLEADQLLRLVCDRRGIDVLHRDERRGNAARLGKHFPHGGSRDVPHYNPRGRK